MSDSALVQELALTRGALRDAIAIGEKLQARNDAALEWLETYGSGTVASHELAAILRGEA